MQCVCAGFDTPCVNKLLWLSVFVCAHLTLSYSNESLHHLGCSDWLSFGSWATQLSHLKWELYLSTNESHEEFPNNSYNRWRRELSFIWVLVSHMVRLHLLCFKHHLVISEWVTRLPGLTVILVTLSRSSNSLPLLVAPLLCRLEIVFKQPGGGCADVGYNWKCDTSSFPVSGDAVTSTCAMIYVFFFFYSHPHSNLFFCSSFSSPSPKSLLSPLLSSWVSVSQDHWSRCFRSAAVCLKFREHVELDLSVCEDRRGEICFWMKAVRTLPIFLFLIITYTCSRWFGYTCFVKHHCFYCSFLGLVVWTTPKVFNFSA